MSSSSHRKATRFRYSAIDKDGSVHRAVLTAPNLKAAKEILLVRHAHILSLEEIVSQSWLELLSGFHDASEALPVYTRGLAVMMDAGLPLARMFDTAARGEDHFLNKVMKDVANSLRDGRSLSQSLGRWNTVFDRAFLGMVKAAEKSGRLHITLRRIATLLEKRWKLNKRLRSAFAYPILVSLVALAVFWILVAWVVPGLVPVFASMGVMLPWPTRVLVWLGNFSTSLPVILACLVGGVLGVGALYRMVVKGEHFPLLHLAWDRFRLSLPLVGDLMQIAILSRTLSTMAALIESGLPLTDVLNSAGQVSGSPVYQRKFDRVLAAIRDGDTFSKALDGAQGFPPLLIGIAQVGEESGKLPFLLVKASQVYEEDLDMRLNTLTTLLEPIMLGMMGLVIGFIVLGTFMPLISLIQQF